MGGRHLLFLASKAETIATMRSPLCLLFHTPSHSLSLSLSLRGEVEGFWGAEKTAWWIPFGLDTLGVRVSV